MTTHRRFTGPVEAMAQRVVCAWDARAARLRFPAGEADLSRIPPGG